MRPLWQFIVLSLVVGSVIVGGVGAVLWLGVTAIEHFGFGWLLVVIFLAVALWAGVIVVSEMGWDRSSDDTP